MRHLSRVGIWMAAVLATTAVLWPGQPPQQKQFLAPTYYLAAMVNDCEPDPNYVEFRGASNLPPGAVISTEVADLDGWKPYSNRVYVPVGKEGFFSGKIEPRNGMRFRQNLILRVVFQTNFAKQPPSVLAILGKKGEYLAGVQNPMEHPYDLAGLSNNPQLYQVSGWYYGLETIAIVPHCGEK